MTMAHVRMWLAALTLLAVHHSTAQTIVATNSTPSDSSAQRDTSLTISRNDDMVPLAPVLPLTNGAVDDIPVRCAYQMP